MLAGSQNNKCLENQGMDFQNRKEQCQLNPSVIQTMDSMPNKKKLKKVQLKTSADWIEEEKDV